MKPSRSSSPLTKRRAEPACAKASWNVPLSSGITTPATRMDQSPVTVSGARLPNDTKRRPDSSSVSTAGPSNSLPANLSPTKPSGARSTASPTTEGAVEISHPRSNTISTSVPQRTVSASSGVVRRYGVTCAEPPPMTEGAMACGPITATRVSDSRVRGRTPSLLSKTIDSAAASRNRCRVSALGALRSWVGSGASSTPIRSRPERNRKTAASRSVSATSPWRTESATFDPRARPGPGISRSRPAPSDVAVSATANQSVMTSPSNPHSSRRMSRRNPGCWVSQRPLSRL